MSRPLSVAARASVESSGATDGERPFVSHVRIYSSLLCTSATGSLWIGKAGRKSGGAAHSSSHASISSSCSEVHSSS
jgi:hypothetical protein